MYRRGADDDWNNTSRVKRGFSAMIFDGEDTNMQVMVLLFSVSMISMFSMSGLSRYN